jgi:two-component system response regulator NreC
MPSGVSRATVVVGDDHAIVRTGVRALLDTRAEFEIVAESDDAASLVAQVGAHQPQVALVDLHMPGPSGAGMIAELRERSPQTKVVVLTMEGDPVFAARALRAGAAGYVLKESAPFVLLEALEVVLAGGVYLEPSLGAKLGSQEVTDPLERLTSRERTVPSGVAEGLTNREIADRLYLSVRTVESHRANLQRKLGLQGTVALTDFARRHELVGHEHADGDVEPAPPGERGA